MEEAKTSPLPTCLIPQPTVARQSPQAVHRTSKLGGDGARAKGSSLPRCGASWQYAGQHDTAHLGHEGLLCVKNIKNQCAEPC